jgi:hypothetical protein
MFGVSADRTDAAENSGNPARSRDACLFDSNPAIFMLGRIDAMLGRVRRQAGSRWQCEALS